MAKTVQVRVDPSALHRWRVAVDLNMTDSAAANSALFAACDLPQRKADAAHAALVRFFAWLTGDEVACRSLCDGDYEITVAGTEVHARIGSRRFGLGQIPNVRADADMSSTGSAI